VRDGRDAAQQIEHYIEARLHGTQKKAG
jgi:hypothetical protein